MNIRLVVIHATILFSLSCGWLVQASAAALISVGPYTPSTTMPFVVPIDITGAVGYSCDPIYLGMASHNWADSQSTALSLDRHGHTTLILGR